MQKEITNRYKSNLNMKSKDMNKLVFHTSESEDSQNQNDRRNPKQSRQRTQNYSKRKQRNEDKKKVEQVKNILAYEPNTICVSLMKQCKDQQIEYSYSKPINFFSSNEKNDLCKPKSNSKLQIFFTSSQNDQQQRPQQKINEEKELKKAQLKQCVSLQLKKEQFRQPQQRLFFQQTEQDNPKSTKQQSQCVEKTQKEDLYNFKMQEKVQSILLNPLVLVEQNKSILEETDSIKLIQFLMTPLLNKSPVLLTCFINKQFFDLHEFHFTFCYKQQRRILVKVYKRTLPKNTFFYFKLVVNEKYEIPFAKMKSNFNRNTYILVEENQSICNEYKFLLATITKQDSKMSLFIPKINKITNKAQIIFDSKNIQMDLKIYKSSAFYKKSIEVLRPTAIEDTIYTNLCQKLYLKKKTNQSVSLSTLEESTIKLFIGKIDSKTFKMLIGERLTLVQAISYFIAYIES